jgi:hypothetical protein
MVHTGDLTVSHWQLSLSIFLHCKIGSHLPTFRCAFNNTHKFPTLCNPTDVLATHKSLEVAVGYKPAKSLSILEVVVSVPQIVLEARIAKLLCAVDG